MEYKIDGTKGKPITQETAKKWSENYQKKNPGEIKAHFFGKDIIAKILAEDGWMGIRIYYALDDSGQKELLLIGADRDGNNLLPSQKTRM